MPTFGSGNSGTNSVRQSYGNRLPTPKAKPSGTAKPKPTTSASPTKS